MGDESHLTALRQETIAIQTDTANVAREAAEMDRERARLALARERLLHGALTGCSGEADRRELCGYCLSGHARPAATPAPAPALCKHCGEPRDHWRHTPSIVFGGRPAHEFEATKPR